MKKSFGTLLAVAMSASLALAGCSMPGHPAVSRTMVTDTMPHSVIQVFQVNGETVFHMSETVAGVSVRNAFGEDVPFSAEGPYVRVPGCHGVLVLYANGERSVFRETNRCPVSRTPVKTVTAETLRPEPEDADNGDDSNRLVASVSESIGSLREEIASLKTQLADRIAEEAGEKPVRRTPRTKRGAGRE